MTHINKGKIFPSRLNLGDGIRVVAPSLSLNLLTEENIVLATKKLESLGLKVTFAKNVKECDEFMSSSIKSRIDDLHEAFTDQNVKMIMPVIGGYNSNQLLKYLDFDLIKNNPKIIGGFSDTTALQNAIFAKTGFVTFQSPAFSMFSKLRNAEYSIEYFKKCFFESGEIELLASQKWDDATWYIDQQNYDVIENEGIWPIQNYGNTTKVSGTIIGGNLCTLNLLHGTEFMPEFNENTILLIEDDALAGADTIVEFERNLVSLIMQKNFDKVKALVLGRFQMESKVTKEKLTKIIQTKDELKHIPVLANLDFGHTYPAFSFPIGGKCELREGKIFIKW
jgi:muramoyltetrapeptide carboxypeptidase LdcA involved in peptidoglycan recycling